MSDELNRTTLSTPLASRVNHPARAKAATNALDGGADMGHASVSTTRVYDHRKTQPEDSPTFKVKYLAAARRTRAPSAIPGRLPCR